MTIKTGKYEKRSIDLRGPQGNAFNLLGVAQDWLKQLGHDKEYIKLFLDDMRSSDYTHLVKVFHDRFGSICDLIVPEHYEDVCTEDEH